MSIAEIGTEFKFIGAELVEHSNMRPLSDWEDGDLLEVVAHVKMQGATNPLYWNARDMSSSTVREDLLEIIPAAKPKPWSGPEDGLPPVGTVCELRTKRGGWGEAEIKYQGRRGICVWLWVRRDGNSEQVEWAESPDKLEFRAIRTPAQIASEKRETAIRELMDIAQVDCRVTAARLVDAGFKREVV